MGLCAPLVTKTDTACLLPYRAVFSVWGQGRSHSGPWYPPLASDFSYPRSRAGVCRQRGWRSCFFLRVVLPPTFIYYVKSKHPSHALGYALKLFPAALVLDLCPGPSPGTGVPLSGSWRHSLWMASEGPGSFNQDFIDSDLTFPPGVRVGDRSRQRGLGHR